LEFVLLHVLSLHDVLLLQRNRVPIAVEVALPIAADAIEHFDSFLGKIGKI
jgi:hypothetical protein